MQKLKQILHQDKPNTTDVSQSPETSNMVDITVYKGDEQGKIYHETTKKELGPRDVLIRVTHSGVCGTDVRKSASQHLLSDNTDTCH
jgi:hypothetical protein